MIRHGTIATLVLVTGLSVAGFGLLTAQEPQTEIPRQRVSPKLLKQALAERPVVVTATAPHTNTRCIHDLRTIAQDLDAAGQKAEASRLKIAILEIQRKVEHEIADKQAQVKKLTSEIEDLKAAIAE
ncbi:MAG: hypothetical protein JSS49_24480 [Planctomycetes bacterium]|nr:hypothetical protein [Planctomycetota bacterium]